MFKYNCLNNIAQVGLDGFDDNFIACSELSDADCALVRSASLHETELPEKLLAIARAGAGVNNIPLDRMAENGVVVMSGLALVRIRRAAVVFLKLVFSVR